jgi:hypothetical protein
MDSERIALYQCIVRCDARRTPRHYGLDRWLARPPPAVRRPLPVAPCSPRVVVARWLAFWLAFWLDDGWMDGC